MRRSITVVSELYGETPKDQFTRDLMKERVLSDRMTDLAYAGEPNINKAILFDAWERLPLNVQEAFLRYAVDDFKERKALEDIQKAERDALKSAQDAIDDNTDPHAKPYDPDQAEIEKV